GISTPIAYQSFSLRSQGDTAGLAATPARVVFQGLDAAGNPDASKNPDTRRSKMMGGYFDPLLKGKSTAGQPAGGYQFTGGNEFFGTNLLPGVLPVAFPLLYGASYRAYFSRGPMSPIRTMAVSGDSSVGSGVQQAILPILGTPSGWAAFDVPGPSQRTTGGMLPAEQLSSALANGVNVVGRSETDEFADGQSLYTTFRQEFITGDATTDATGVSVIGSDPFVVNARSSALSEGTFTGLFSPTPDPSIPFGGALPSMGWTAADFIGQGGGAYVIANRPRGPQGLFTVHPVVPGVALGSGANGWWLNTDARANGRHTGDFDAIELLRAEGCNPADPTTWFTEFKNVRADWFNLLNLQTPMQFTKGLGLSSGVFSLDTPVGQARTYLHVGSIAPSQTDQSSLLAVLQSGAAVASTGPLLDVTIGGQIPGGFVTGTNATVPLTISLWAPN
ncbi:MAG: hypothetical protein ACREP9_19885, partial [Candidatus Dormibacteraceae bacterium]